MTNLRQDIQFGFRMLLKSRGLAGIPIFALALGIGANTAIFSVVNTILLPALPTFQRGAPLPSIRWWRSVTNNFCASFARANKAWPVAARVCAIKLNSSLQNPGLAY